MNQKGTVIVVGGGVAGLCSAYYLAKAGYSVTVIDKGDFTQNCSNGNAGMIVPSHFTPLAAPGIISQGLRWLLSAKSPFYIRPSLSLSLLQWGWQFYRHANAEHVEKSAKAICDLNTFSSVLYKDFATKFENNFELTHRGILMLYRKESTREEEVHLAEKAKQLGLEVNILNKEQVQAIEPNVEVNVLGAAHYLCDSHLYPTAFLAALKMALQQMNVQCLLNTTVIGFEKQKNKITQVRTNHGDYKADAFVLTGGAALQTLAKLAAQKILVIPGKGYSFMTDAFGDKLLHPSILLDDRVAITPMNGQVRVGGTMELGTEQNKIRRNRVQGIIDAVPKYYPQQKLSFPVEEKIWYGYRPCSPDGLPYLGRSASFDNLFIGGGLGMMGMSLGPAVGKTIADLVDNIPTATNISLFRPNRFES